MNGSPMSTPTRHWAVALIGSTIVHAGLLWMAMVALSGKTSLKAATAALQREVRLADRTSIPVRLIGASPRGHLLQPEVPSKPIGSAGSARPRRKVLTAPIIAHAANDDDAVPSNGDPANISKGGPPTLSDGEPSGNAKATQGIGGSASGEDATGLHGTGSLTSHRLLELHQRLASAARRCYPGTAHRLRQRGTVQLHFCLSPQGTASTSRLEGTTGSGLLDRAALECVLPGALPAPGMPGCYDVAIRFDDED